MRQLNPKLEPNRISGSDSIRKSSWNPKVPKSYDVPVKTRKKKCRSDQFGQSEDLPPSPQLIAGFKPLMVLGRLRRIGCDSTGRVKKPLLYVHSILGMVDDFGSNLYKPSDA